MSNQQPRFVTPSKHAAAGNDDFRREGHGRGEIYGKSRDATAEDDQRHNSGSRGCNIVLEDICEDCAPKRPYTSQKNTYATPLKRQAEDRCILSQLKLPHDLRTVDWINSLSFMMKFELMRLYNQCKLDDMQVKELMMEYSSMGYYSDESLSFCDKISQLSGVQLEYRRALEGACEFDLLLDQGIGSIFSFSADLKRQEARQSDEEVVVDTDKFDVSLNSPKIANDCRIYRRFGSHRFLELQVPSSVYISSLDRLFRNPINVLSRQYRLLWVKVDVEPQVYILFAESGLGITPSEENTVEQIDDWCIPAKINEGLSVSKKVKRMKLSFSTTKFGGILPHDALSRVPDIIAKCNGVDVVMTDGCGLISRDGINYVWSKYVEYLSTRQWISGSSQDDDRTGSKYSEVCPYTSFQGRIGSLKGMWVLDESLGKGIKVLYRDSQKKYNLPMKSLISHQESIGTITSFANYDESYDGVDIIGWDSRPKAATLSIRIVQILESRGVPIQYFKSIASTSVGWLDEIMKGRYGKLIKFVKAHADRKGLIRQGDDIFDDYLLWTMVKAGVPRIEPVFSLLLKETICEKINSIRQKAKYPLEKSCNLRMIPDHTGLLEAGEVYIALYDDILEIEQSCTSILAMRFPAYIAEDMLTLKVATRKTLRFRSSLQPYGDGLYDFFENVRNCLIISSKPLEGQCIADLMSGGDYDGDRAWVCWDKALIQHVKPLPVKPRGDSNEEARQPAICNAEASINDRLQLVSYAHACKHHCTRIGTLSNRLDYKWDRFGVESKETQILAAKAFIQVDNPACFNGNNCGNGENRYPNWSSWREQNTKESLFYSSKKAMGILWELMEDKINSFDIPIEFNPHIAKRLKDMDQIIKIHHTMNVQKIYAEYTHQCMQFFASPSTSEQGPSSKKFWNDIWIRTRKRLFHGITSEDDRLNAASVLYELVETNRIQDSGRLPSGVFESKRYTLAWRVAHDYLTRIIADATCRSKCSGIAVSVSRDYESILFSRRFIDNND